MKEIDLSNDYDKYLEYLDSRTWARIRDKALERDKYECSICHSPHNLEVHHLKYPDVLGTEPISDLMTLCRECHKKLEDYKKGHKVIRKMTLWRPPEPPKEEKWELWVRIKDRETATQFIDSTNSSLVHWLELGGTSLMIVYLDDEKTKKVVLRNLRHSDIEYLRNEIDILSAVMDLKVVKEQET